MAISKYCLAIIASMTLMLGQVASATAQVLSPDAVTSISPTTPLETTPTAETDPESKDGAWSKMSMPKMSLPKLSMPKLSMPSWPKNEDGIAMSPFTPITEGMSAGARKISAGTKKAWNGTKGLFSFGGEKKEQPQSTYVAEKPRTSLWDKLKGQPEEPQVPETMVEWMSQPRPK